MNTETPDLSALDLSLITFIVKDLTMLTMSLHLELPSPISTPTVKLFLQTPIAYLVDIMNE